MKRITVTDYHADSAAHVLADNLMRQYGYDPNDVDIIEIDDHEIRFRVLVGLVNDNPPIYEWRTHDR